MAATFRCRQVPGWNSTTVVLWGQLLGDLMLSSLLSRQKWLKESAKWNDPKIAKMPNTTSTSYVPPRINHTVTETTLF
jgi:hypothetical protein